MSIIWIEGQSELTIYQSCSCRNVVAQQIEFNSIFKCWHFANKTFGDYSIPALQKHYEKQFPTFNVFVFVMNVDCESLYPIN